MGSRLVPGTGTMTRTIVGLKKDTQALLDVSDRLLTAGCRVRFRASGLSMHPSIRDGEMLDVERVEFTSIQLGDVLLYRHMQRPIAHRVVQIYQEGGAISGFLLRGDGKAACDAPIGPHQVLGRVIQNPWRTWPLFDYLKSWFSALRNHP